MDLVDKFEILKLFIGFKPMSLESIFKSLNAQKETLNFTQIQNVINSIESLMDDGVLILKGGDLCLQLEN